MFLSAISRRLQIVAAMLLAAAFMMLPGSAQATCLPHSEITCAIDHMDTQDGSLPADHDMASHEHAHGACHIPMVQPAGVALSALEFDDAAFVPGQQATAPRSTPTCLERPPRV